MTIIISCFVLRHLNGIIQSFPTRDMQMYVCATVVALSYRKFPKYSDTQKICCNHSKIWTMWLYHRVMSPNHADGMANSVNPDQEQSDLGLHCIAQAYLSENLGSLR